MVRKMSLTIRLESFSKYGVTTAIQACTCPMGDTAEWKTKGMPKDYIIAVNADLPEKEQVSAFIHEMLHLWHDDVRTMNPKDVGHLEYLRHKETAEVIDALREGGAF